jgi:hypothetical protein
MEVSLSIKTGAQVTKVGKKPFNFNLKCPVCGEQMRIESFNGGCSDLDGNFFGFICNICATEVNVNTENI